jgi:hypothetical protein
MALQSHIIDSDRGKGNQTGSQNKSGRCERTPVGKRFFGRRDVKFLCFHDLMIDI